MHLPTGSWLRGIACAVGFAALAASTSAAAVSCPADDACNGNSYTASYIQIDSDTWTVQVDIHVLSSYVGTLNSDLLSAVAIKPDGSASNATLVSYPTGGDSFSLFLAELNANGCEGGNSGSLCAGAGAGKGVSFEAGETLGFVFQFDAASIGDSVHLKYLYLGWDAKKNEWAKVGAVGSFDIPLLAHCTGESDPRDPCLEGGGGSVPVPASVALMALGLVAVGATRRRRRMHR